MAKDSVKCIIEDCIQPAVSRGLCKACYSSARLRICSKVATWKQLETMQLALPVTSKKGSSAFTEAFNEKIESEKQEAQNAANVEEDLEEDAAYTYEGAEYIEEAASPESYDPCKSVGSATEAAQQAATASPDSAVQPWKTDTEPPAVGAPSPGDVLSSPLPLPSPLLPADQFDESQADPLGYADVPHGAPMPGPDGQD